MGILREGIYEYDENDTVSPTVSELLNMLGDSVRDKLATLEVAETVLVGAPSYEVRLSVSGGIATVSAQGTAPLAAWTRWDLFGLVVPAYALPKRLKIGHLEVENQEANHPLGSFLILPTGGMSLRHKSATPTTSATTWAASCTYAVGA